MTEPTRTEWLHPDDEAWGDRLLARLLVTHDVALDDAESAVEDARRACHESGRTAAELFGSADAHAREVANDIVPVTKRAAVDLDGASPRDRWTLLLLGTGWLGSIWSIWLLVADGWWVDVEPAALALLAGIVVGAAGTWFGTLARTAGDLRGCWSWWALGAVGIVAGAVGASSFSDVAPLGEVPTLVVLAAAVAVIVVGFVREEPRAEPDPAPGGTTPDAWFDRLHGLLRGRYHLPRATARQHVADARSHWTDTGSVHPEDEFGTPEVYALELLDGSPEPERRKARYATWLYTVVAGYWAFVTTTTVLDDGSLWSIVWRAVAFLLFAGSAVSAWRRSKPAAAA
ncbi:hypothetical protein [Sanguibacter suaedae]|uniref:Uncharacterized protein n=1 Tax=Sanguibacter suaedae TaxID=2795737 RepID=A0A934I596_9MICO|nr:hypothetical protein [Sanguibacter suaedae]MBI9114496.1 hypothetical protein [Sanguibacter suaedae]